MKLDIFTNWYDWYKFRIKYEKRVEMKVDTVFALTQHFKTLKWRTIIWIIQLIKSTQLDYCYT